MIFSDIPANASLFIDANTFVYHFMPHPTLGIVCADLLARIKRLSGDALIVAVMQQFGLASIASHDADFDRVPWITRYGPA